jgi:amidase
VVRWFDHAREVASGELPDGPFRGVPFLLKDLWVHYAGQTMTNGNVAFKADKPISMQDSVLVSRFKNTGVVTLGRSASPEMGTLPVTETAAHGPTRNPWDTDRVPGGSSGGAAAAVAAGLVPIAHASDGGGSIRIPASCCGLVGLKTSQGRITMQPHGLESSLGVDFCVSRSVRDSASMLDAVHGPGVGDSVIAPPPSRPYVSELGVDPGRLRIGLLDHHPHGGPVHDECVTAVRNAAGLLEGLGHHVEASHPSALDDASFVGRFMALWATTRASGLANMAKHLGRDLTEEEVEPHNWAQVQYAEAMTAVQYADALSAVAEFRRATQQWWADGWDLLLTPTLAEPPIRIGECTSTSENPMAGMARAGVFVPFTPAFNTTGQPAISLPLHWSPDGLPIGIQLVAAYGREDLLLRVASQIEAAAPWAGRRPPSR